MSDDEPLALVDTSCWIEYLHPEGARTVQQVLKRAIESDRVAVCGIVIAELIRGASQENAPLIRKLFTGLHYLLQEDRYWRQVEEVSLRLQARGEQPPLLDLLMAVVASTQQAALWHYGDRHFAIISSVLPLQVVDLSKSSERPYSGVD